MLGEFVIVAEKGVRRIITLKLVRF